jgi:hypothetical protein
MTFRIISISPNGMQENPLMNYLYDHLKVIKSFGKGSPITSMSLLYIYLRKASNNFCRINPQASRPEPLVLSLRKAACCGEELIVQQGDFNITIKPYLHE